MVDIIHIVREAISWGVGTEQSTEGENGRLLRPDVCRGIESLNVILFNCIGVKC
jgi:hypothetical protein